MCKLNVRLMLLYVICSQKINKPITSADNYILQKKHSLNKKQLMKSAASFNSQDLQLQVSS